MFRPTSTVTFMGAEGTSLPHKKSGGLGRARWAIAVSGILISTVGLLVAAPRAFSSAAIGTTIVALLLAAPFLLYGAVVRRSDTTFLVGGILLVGAVWAQWFYWANDQGAGILIFAVQIVSGLFVASVGAFGDWLARRNTSRVRDTSSAEGDRIRGRKALALWGIVIVVVGSSFWYCTTWSTRALAPHTAIRNELASIPLPAWMDPVAQTETPGDCWGYCGEVTTYYTSDREVTESCSALASALYRWDALVGPRPPASGPCSFSGYRKDGRLQVFANVDQDVSVEREHGLSRLASGAEGPITRPHRSIVVITLSVP